MFGLNWMGLLEVALRQRITLQETIPLLAEKTRECKFLARKCNLIQGKHKRLFMKDSSTNEAQHPMYFHKLI